MLVELTAYLMIKLNFLPNGITPMNNSSAMKDMVFGTTRMFLLNWQVHAGIQKYLTIIMD